LADHEQRVGLGPALGETSAKGFHFFLRNRRRLPAGSVHQPNKARNLKNSDSIT
jgi:hypothetical protein